MKPFTYVTAFEKGWSPASMLWDIPTTFPGNYTFHTVNDTPDKITNKRLWLKAAKLTLATALDLARATQP